MFDSLKINKPAAISLCNIFTLDRIACDLLCFSDILFNVSSAFAFFSIVQISLESSRFDVSWNDFSQTFRQETICWDFLPSSVDKNLTQDSITPTNKFVLEVSLMSLNKREKEAFLMKSDLPSDDALINGLIKAFSLVLENIDQVR